MRKVTVHTDTHWLSPLPQENRERGSGTKDSAAVLVRVRKVMGEVLVRMWTDGSPFHCIGKQCGCSSEYSIHGYQMTHPSHY